MNKDEKVEENPVFQNGIQKSEERRKSLSEIEKEVKGILVENVFAEVRRSIKVEVKREIQENDDIKVLRATLQLFQEEKHKDEKVEENPVFQEVMRRICVLEQHSMRRCTVHSETQVAKSSGDDERGVNESVNSLLKSSTDKIVPVAENLENRKKELEPKVKRLETKANGMKTLHDLKEEIGVRDRLSKVVTRFANRLPVMVGVLGVLFTITFPCKLRKVFSWLIGFSLMGLLVMAGLAAFHFWEISKDIDVLKTVHEKLNSPRKNDLANGDMDLERGEKLKPEKKNDKANGDMDLERGEKLKPEKKNDKANGDIDLDRGEKFQFGTFWSYAWRHVVDRGEKLKPEKKNDKTNGDMDLERGEKLKPEKKNDKANGDMDLARGEKLKPEKKNDKANGDMDLERGEKLKPEKKNDKANGDIDLDRGEKFQFGTFWSYAWPHVVDTFFLLLLALGFVISVGVFIYSEKCVEVDPLAPAPSPAVPSPFLS